MPTSSARPRSLRRRLLVLLLGLTALTWLATATIGYLRARHEAAELLDAHLAQAAALLVAQSGEELDEIELEHAPALDRHAPKVAFQLWEDGRQLRLHSRNAPNERFSPVEEGFSDATHGGDGWRVFSAWDAEHELLIQVGERSRARDEIAAALGASLALPLAVALPLLGFAIWWSVGAALRPLERLRHDLSRRDPLRLAALDPALAPEEVRPLVEEINTLFARIDTLLQRERRFTADAAHELRSPLAALATQAQVARAATDDAVRSEALEALVAGARRAARLVEQLLTLARLESGGQPGSMARCDLREIVRAEIAEHAPRALEKGLELALEDGPPVWMNGDAGLLAILARNLVDNAVRYTPDGGTIEAGVWRDGQDVRLEVRNSGPPLPSDALARLGERFYRPAGAEEPGSGLGLSIVGRIAELHGGRVRYSGGPDGSGFRAMVEFSKAE